MRPLDATQKSDWSKGFQFRDKPRVNYPPCASVLLLSTRASGVTPYKLKRRMSSAIVWIKFIEGPGPVSLAMKRGISMKRSSPQVYNASTSDWQLDGLSWYQKLSDSLGVNGSGVRLRRPIQVRIHINCIPNACVTVTSVRGRPEAQWCSSAVGEKSSLCPRTCQWAVATSHRQRHRRHAIEQVEVFPASVSCQP